MEGKCITAASDCQPSVKNNCIVVVVGFAANCHWLTASCPLFHVEQMLDRNEYLT
jgi:hypothetical protein